jgi:hypothetical protein
LSDERTFIDGEEGAVNGAWSLVKCWQVMLVETLVEKEGVKTSSVVVDHGGSRM